tara:strand:- start:643 stop:840 length:198 start_codon:yes stop_codon:yes gene_type:complete
MTLIVFYSAACQSPQPEDRPEPMPANHLLGARGSASSEACPNGGIEFDSGLDQNGNGELEAHEVS